MSQEPKNKEEGFMYKFASFIVDKRNLIFLIVAIGLVFSVFSRSWVQVECLSCQKERSVRSVWDGPPTCRRSLRRTRACT